MRQPQEDRVKIIAHRGNGPTSKFSADGRDVPKEYAPENTLKAFQKAINENADGIEFDIYVSCDNVPMVIHDNELNINVKGANRNTRELGLVSEQTREELKKYDVGQGERIPTLEETLNLIVQSGKELGKPIIINIELKGIGSAEHTLKVVQQFIKEELVNTQDVIYCSFIQEELEEIRKLDETAQIACAVKTAELFGEENVIKPEWFVPLDIEYKDEVLKALQDRCDSLKPVAFDVIIFDIDKPLIELAESNKIGIHASTSDFRNFTNTAFLQLLTNMNEKVLTYFKTDEPGKIRTILEKMIKLEEIDLSAATIMENKEIVKLGEIDLSAATIMENKGIAKPEEIDLSATTITENKEIGIFEKNTLKRIPKLGQEEAEKKFNRGI